MLDPHEIGALVFLAGWLALVIYGLRVNRREARARELDVSTLRTGLGRSAFKAHRGFD